MADITDEDLGILKEIGKVSAEAMLHAASMVKPGAKLLDVAESSEKFLKDKGFGMAFPINISTNEQAAHYTPSLGDEKAFGENDIVKIDFGAERDGLLGDGAVTVDLSGKLQDMIEAAENALSEAIGMIRHGVSVCDVGKTISDTVEKAGFVPIKNLGGHGIGKHDLHRGLFIPNYDNGDFTVLEEGMVVAIEPFVTTGKGMVVDSDICDIYSYVGEGQPRSIEARTVLDHIARNHSEEPFAVRWLSGISNSKFRLYASISELVKCGAIEPHPTLVEVSGKEVAQAEAQVVVTKDGCDVITRVKR